MFLDWISQLRLLQHDPQTNILGSLPLSIRRVLISEITSYLCPPPGRQAPEPSIFSSPAHVKWFMEVIGQGFNLPLEDMDITGDDVDIYARWLFEQDTRPATVVEEGLEQEFYQIIFHQYSLLFQPRIARPNVITQPISQNQQQSISQQIQQLQQQQQQQQQSTPLQQPQSQQANGIQQQLNNSRNANFHINMLPVNPHNNIMPVSFTTNTNTNPNNNSNNNSSYINNNNNNSNNSSSNYNTNTNNTNNAPTNAIKETLSQLVLRHVELCKKTLKVFAMAGRTLKLSEETWIVLLKVVLGITDYLLKDPTGETSPLGVMNMADELCDTLLQVLFELWLRSKTMNVEMWDILKSCYSRWTHRSKTIIQWGSTSLALTRRIQNLTYGKGQGTEAVHLSSVNGISSGVKLDLPGPFVHYAWHRLLYLIPHPLQLPSRNFTLAILGIGSLVDALNQPNFDDYPDGNTILHMFGSYLFDSASKANQIQKSNKESQKGCAEAFATLCKIFCTPQKRQPFLRTYIEKFYAALSVGLENDACLPTILLCCTKLFATDLEGVRMLVPEFIKAIKLVLPKLRFDFRSNNVSVDNLRLAAIKVLSTIMCLPNHFETVHIKWETAPLPPPRPIPQHQQQQQQQQQQAYSGEQEQLVTELIRVLYAEPNSTAQDSQFISLKYYILEVLLTSLRTETSSYNMRYILHLINVYVIEDVPFCPGLVGTVVKLIQDKILTMQLPADVTLVAFDVLMDFVDLYDFVKRDSKNVARELVLALSRYVDTLITAGKLASTYPLIVQAYDCMIKWILVSQWIIDDHDCYKAVIATLSKGITIFDRDSSTFPVNEQQQQLQNYNQQHQQQSQHQHQQNATGANLESSGSKKKRRDTAFPPTKQLFQLQPRKAHQQQQQQQNEAIHQQNMASSHTVHKKEEIAVRMAAEYCMSQFVNQLGRFALPNEHALGGCRSALVDDIEQLKKAKGNIRYFLVDKQILLAIIDTTDKMPNSQNQEVKQIPSVVVVIRDTTGKYVWSMETQYKDPLKEENNGSTKSPISQPLSPSNQQQHLYQLQHHKLEKAVSIPFVTAVNESELPTMDKLFVAQSNEWNEWESIKELMRQQEEAIRNKSLQLQNKNNDYQLVPTKANIDVESARGFRLLLAQIGYLLPHNRKHITPLRISDSIISEMETLDMLNERDCISISAYYAVSGNTGWDELVESPKVLSEQFLQFIDCLGWPVETSSHRGFKSKLDPAICDRIPYYSDRTIEFVVNVPYFLKKPFSENDMEWGNMNTIAKIHQQISSDDHVCVIWIEDLTNYKELAKMIKTNSLANSKAMVYIFINPLRNSANGLYWIRILVPPFGHNTSAILASQRLYENALIFGPLVDGIVVSRHALGSMVRNTAISAHQACRVVTDTYTRPYAIRKEYIEEMSHRHRAKLPLSEFYADIFTDRVN